MCDILYEHIMQLDNFYFFQLQFEDDLKISKMYSAEGECVNYCESLYPTGNVEDWMSEIERVMKESLRLIIEDSLYDYKLVFIFFSIYYLCINI